MGALKLVEKATKYPLSNSDYEMGHSELGFMRFLKKNLRKDSIDWMEAEDIRFQRFVRRHRRMHIRVVNGIAYVRES